LKQKDRGVFTCCRKVEIDEDDGTWTGKAVLYQVLNEQVPVPVPVHEAQVPASRLCDTK